MTGRGCRNMLPHNFTGLAYFRRGYLYCCHAPKIRMECE